MKDKLLFKGPVLTSSGYGVHARQLLKALLVSDLFDISVVPLNWGNTSLILDDSDSFIQLIKDLSSKAEQDRSQNAKYAISIQVTIPNEFEKIAKINIGVTAGIETDIVSPEWILKVNQNVDALIVPSQHSYDVFKNTEYKDGNGNSLKLQKPIYVCPEGFNSSVYNLNPTDSDLDFDTDFNFLFVGLGIDTRLGEERKNVSSLVKWFCETFKGRKDVGLVLKTAVVNNSLMDFELTKKRIQDLKNLSGCGEYPKIHLVHGRLSDGEMASLYKHNKVKCFVSLTHGEGFGLPLLEAAACGLPIMVTNWSGHLDFLNIEGKKSFIALDYKMTPVPESSLWKGVIEKHSNWASPVENDVKVKLRKVVSSYDKPKEWALNLAEHVNNNFSEAVCQYKFITTLMTCIKNAVVDNPKTQEDLLTSAKVKFGIKEDEKALLYTMPMSAGDVFISTAVVSSLKEKFPEHNIYFATQPQYFDILKNNRDIHKVIKWDEWMTNIPMLEKVFDEVYTPNLSVQMTFSNWVHGGKGRKLADELAVQCGVELGQYFIETEKIEGLPEKYIVLHAGSGKGQWEARNYLHWQELVENLNRELLDRDISIVQVGLTDDPLYDNVSFYDNIVDLRGKTTYNQLAYVIENSILTLGIDSISMHLAAALGTDHVALFGSSYPTSTGPVVKLRLDGNQICESVLLETPDRYSCKKACYQYQCSVDKDHPCINEIKPETVYHHVMDIVTQDNAKSYGAFKEYCPKISGYTHVLNAKTHGYPFVESIKSMLGFCDEVVVIDGGSDDGTVEAIRDINSDKINIIERAWDWDEPGMDGMQKAYGRAMCTGDFLWQQDVDEVVHELDYVKIRNIVKRFPKDVDLIHLPVIELWGDEHTVRTDRHSWKWRLSRNNFRITHAINKDARLVDKNTGRVYAKKGMSDGCEYVDIMSNEYIPHRGFYTRDLENVRLNDPETYGKMMNEIFQEIPSVYHYSWCDLHRKVKNFKQFWNKCWNNLYRDENPEDRFPEVKDENDVESIKAVVDRLRIQGGENEAPTFELKRSNPSVMKGWLSERS